MSKKRKSPVLKAILFVIGCIALALGGIGIALPVLPTTPLVLLGAICFSYASDTLYDRLIKTRHFGPFIENYKCKNGVPRRIKIEALCFMWIMMILSICLCDTIWLKGLLCIIGLCVTAHIALLKTRQ